MSSEFEVEGSKTTPAGAFNPRLGETRSRRLSGYFRIYTTLWRNSIVREMSFKMNFIL
jgi:hypothetical protein